MIAFVLICTATVALGLLLKSRSDLIDDRLPAEDTAEQTSPQTDDPGNTPSTGDKLSLQGVHLDLSGCADASEAVRLVRLLVAGGPNGVTFLLSDAGGSLLYASEVDVAVARGRGSGISMQVLLAAVGQANAEGLRTTALLTPGAFLSGAGSYETESLAFDLALVREIRNLGFSELLLIDLPFGDTLSVEETQRLIGYLSGIKSAAGSMEIGCAFPSSYLTDAETASQLDRMLYYTDFYALDLRRELDAADRAASLDQTLNPENMLEESLGILFASISSKTAEYNLRILFTAETDVRRATVKKILASAKINNYESIQP